MGETLLVEEGASESAAVAASAQKTSPVLSQDYTISETSGESPAAQNGGNERIRQGHELRKGIPPWRWRMLVCVIWFWAWLNGYDVSNVANIQPNIYEQFHSIEFLPWIALSYATSVFASFPLGRQLCKCFDMRWLAFIGTSLFAVGCAVAGASSNMAMLIVGRVLTGIGGALMYNCSWSYIAVLADPTESAIIVSMIGVFWSIGLIVGGPISSGFAQNRHATWRWAFYIVVVLMGTAIALTSYWMPRYSSLSSQASLSERFRRTDAVGVALTMSSVALFSIALTFSGPVWSWDSGGAIGTWVAFAVLFIALIIQQAFCLFTTPESRAIPLTLIFKRRMLPIWIACVCSGAIYGVNLYYLPLFFAFMRGMGPIQQAVRLFPFIFVLIVFVALTGCLLPIIQRYKYSYIIAGAICLAAEASLAATLKTSVSDSQVLGLIALTGIGLGMHFLQGNSLANAMLSDVEDRLDASLICNMGLFSGISLSLVVAGSVFQNVGYQKLSHIFEGQNLTRSDIQETLAGVSSLLVTVEPELRDKALDAVCTILGRLFYIAAAAGGLCMICGLAMENEKLQFKNTVPPVEEEARTGAAEKA